jgi:CubicO group peptidase (beta-lactamase class C family)
MRSNISILAFTLFLIGCATVDVGYKAVKCDTPLPYEGKPLYHGSVELPPNEYRIGGAFDEAKVLKFNNTMLEAISYTKARVMSAAVATQEDFWWATRAADGSSQELRLYWASVGKAMTATVILQLMEEDKISLKDTVAQWVSYVPNASSITVDHLLLYTSGLFSANEDLVFRKNLRYYTPEERIRISAKHGAMFCPGQWWRYSNIGYTILGKIIEYVEGRPYYEKENTAKLFEHLYPIFEKNIYYGRGVMLYSVPDSTTGKKTLLGHSGGTPGCKAVIAYSPVEKSFVAVALTGDGSAEASANLLLKQLGVEE